LKQLLEPLRGLLSESRRLPPLGSNQVVPDRILNELSIGTDVENFHNAIFVKGHSSCRQIQNGGDFLHAFAFGKELQHFTLALGELVSLVYELLVLAQEKIDRVFCDRWREVGLASEDLPNRSRQFRGGTGLEQISRRSSTERTFIASCSVRRRVVSTR